MELSGTAAVVKQLVGGPEATERYAREVAALTLASRIDPPVVPMLLGTDPDQRVLVLEYLEYLEHQRPREDWVVTHAEALARLHGCSGVEDTGVRPAWSDPTPADIGSFFRLLLRARPRARRRRQQLTQRLGVVSQMTADGGELDYSAVALTAI
ncbi:hypothetical protein ND748_12350 [Frankia sp. AiPs1]|uniref:hypothetical protein n=1 Tax=Frankia sp. AiPs1 TaxID=573493 RepID=UPI0020438EDE|nr:hypothetical protein [Frankia sp. AiPs1]MCM3922445.1 hypothetical protein [Frankia sp. AiPs1]